VAWHSSLGCQPWLKLQEVWLCARGRQVPPQGACPKHLTGTPTCIGGRRLKRALWVKNGCRVRPILGCWLGQICPESRRLQARGRAMSGRLLRPSIHPSAVSGDLPARPFSL
jgi:hypothetical protein